MHTSTVLLHNQELEDVTLKVKHSKTNSIVLKHNEIFKFINCTINTYNSNEMPNKTGTKSWVYQLSQSTRETYVTEVITV